MQQGFFAVQQTCPRCQGRGQVIKQPCDSCLGQGRVRRKKTLSVKVPAGVDTGDRIRLAGEGEAGRNGGPPGDLYVEIRVREHAIFERDGRHLSCEVPVSFVTATLGGTVDVPTLDGHVELKVPARDSVGPRVPAARQGRQAGARRPDAATCSAASWSRRPVNLTEEQSELLRKFDESLQPQQSQPQPARTLLARRREALLRNDAKLSGVEHGHARALRIAILGCTGRMGRAVLPTMAESPDLAWRRDRLGGQCVAGQGRRGCRGRSAACRGSDRRHCNGAARRQRGDRFHLAGGDASERARRLCGADAR